MAAGGKDGRNSKFPPNSAVNAGDVVGGNGSGWWVVVTSHTTGSGPTPDGLQPGQSNDHYHWAVPQS